MHRPGVVSVTILFMSILVGCEAAPAMKPPKPDASGGASAASATASTSTSTSSSSSDSSSSTGHTSSSTGLSTKTCEELTTVCFGSDQDALSGCAQCAVFGTLHDAVNGGLCRNEYAACFGAAGDCKGGQPACCEYTACLETCDKDKNGIIDADELACVCTTDATGVCATKQTDTNTCLGRFESNADAFQVYETFNQCVSGATGVCSHICYGQ
jgi:hypothetical protein